MVQKNYKIVGLIGVVAALIFPFLMCIVIELCPEEIGGFPFFLDRKDWFSFWGSYAGVFVSLVIGIVTLRLTVRLDHINQENVSRQNRMSVAANIPNMFCTKMVLSSLKDGEVPVPLDKIYLFSKKNNYILSMELIPAFPPYFMIEISSMELVFRSLKDDRVFSEKTEIEEKDYHFTNNKEFNITINLPKEIDEHMQMFTMFCTAISKNTPYEKTVADLWIDFKCSNVLLEQDLGDVSFRMHFQLKNDSNEYTSEGIVFHVVDRKFERIEGIGKG